MRALYYHKDLIDRPRPQITEPLLKKGNIALLTMRQIALQYVCSHFLVTNKPPIDKVFYSNKGAASVFPLYLYTDYQQKTSFQKDDFLVILHFSLVNGVPISRLRLLLILPVNWVCALYRMARGICVRRWGRKIFLTTCMPFFIRRHIVHAMLSFSRSIFRVCLSRRMVSYFVRFAAWRRGSWACT